MSLPQSNAVVTLIAGGGFSEDDGGGFAEGSDTPKWTGSAKAYVHEEVLATVGPAGLNEERQTYIVVPGHLADVLPEDNVTFTYEGTSRTRKVQHVERHTLQGHLRTARIFFSGYVMASWAQEVKNTMIDAAARALALTAEDVKDRAARDAGLGDEHPGDLHLRDSGKTEPIRGEQGELLYKVTFTADHAATQEIGGRWQDKTKRGKGGKFIKYYNHPAGGKEAFVSDALKLGVRKYRVNLKRVIAADLKAKHGAK